MNTFYDQIQSFWFFIYFYYSPKHKMSRVFSFLSMGLKEEDDVIFNCQETSTIPQIRYARSVYRNRNNNSHALLQQAAKYPVTISRMQRTLPLCYCCHFVHVVTINRRTSQQQQQQQQQQYYRYRFVAYAAVFFATKYVARLRRCINSKIHRFHFRSHQQPYRFDQ